ncbi:M48 family metalloprotease, partial [Saprospiraceae bacterium]|nr:M48 family metalloprotease [Saprospiraceae bacterium]
AELAFILCHEISHVIEQHGLENYTKETKRVKWINVEDRDYNSAMFSQEREFQADSLGLQYFLKTDYSIGSFNSLFDKLYFSNTGLVEEAFPKSFFESDKLTIPDSLWNQELINIAAENSYVSEESTHPSSQARLKEINETVAAQKVEDSGTYFLYNEDEFREAVKAARYEVPFLDFENGDYSACIYNCNFLESEFPNNRNFQELIIHSMRNVLVVKQELQKYKSDYDDDDDVYDDETEVIEFDRLKNDSVRYDYSQQIDFFFEDLGLVDYLALTFEKFMALPNDTTNKEMQAIKGDLFYSLVKLIAYKDSLGDLDHKFDIANILIPYLDESTYGKELSIAQERIADYKERLEYFDSNEFEERSAEMEKKGFKLGLDKVLVVAPSFKSLKSKNERLMLDIKKSIQKEDILLKSVEEISTQINIDVQVLTLKKLKKGQVKIAEDIWAIQRDYNAYMAWPSAEFKLIYGRKKMDDIYEKYGTDKILFLNSYTYKGDLRQDLVKKTYSLVIYPIFFYWIDYVEASRYSGFESILYYPNQHGLYVIKNDEYRYRNSPAMLKSKVYDTLNQIKTEKKE